MSTTNGHTAPAAAPSHFGLVIAALLTWLLVTATMLTTIAGDDGRSLFRDTDDYMRLVQVQDFLDGAGWFDVHQDRLNPPDGVTMHWSRLPDLPLAGIVSLLEPIIGRDHAVSAAGIAVPAAQLLALLLVVAWMAAPLVDRDYRAMVPVVAAMAMPLMARFSAGRVDHHAWQLLAAALAFGAFLRLVAAPGRLWPVLPAAAGFALGLWISPEIVPWLALFCAGLIGCWVVDGGSPRAGLAFAALLLAALAAILPLAQPIERWGAVEPDAFSLATVSLAVAIVAVWAILAAAAPWTGSRRARLLTAAGAGTAASAGLLLAFPELLHGPYGDIHAEIKALWLSRVREALPIHTLASRDPAALGLYLGAPLLALGIATACAWRTDGSSRRQWLAIVLVLGCGLAAAEYQLKLISYVHLFAVVPLAYAIAALWQRSAGFENGLKRICWRIGPFLGLIGFVGSPALFGSAAADHAANAPVTNASEAEADAAPTTAGSGGVSSACAVAAVAGAIANAADDEDGPLLIAAPIDAGPELLFRTQHAVLAAPYHRNADGILTTLRLLSATDEGTARQLIAERGIDLILICPDAPEADLYRGVGGISLADRLAAGEVPKWLEPLALPGQTTARLFAVREADSLPAATGWDG